VMRQPVGVALHPVLRLADQVRDLGEAVALHDSLDGVRILRSVVATWPRRQLST
jgi:hypothetical protein